MGKIIVFKILVAVLFFIAWTLFGFTYFNGGETNDLIFYGIIAILSFNLFHCLSIFVIKRFE